MKSNSLASALGALLFVLPDCLSAQDLNKSYQADTLQGKFAFESIRGLKEIEQGKTVATLDEIIDLHVRNKNRIKTWTGKAKTKIWLKPNGTRQIYYALDFTVDNVKKRSKYRRQLLHPNSDNKLEEYGYCFNMQVEKDVYQLGPYPYVSKLDPRLFIRKGKMNLFDHGWDFSPFHYMKVFGKTVEQHLRSVKDDLEPESSRQIKIFEKGPILRVASIKMNAKKEFTIFDIDTSKGANVVQTIERKNMDIVLTKREFELINENWLPKKFNKVSYFYKSNHELNKESMVMELENKINLKLADNAFDLKSIDLEPNTIVIDQRTGKEYRFKELSE